MGVRRTWPFALALLLVLAAAPAASAGDTLVTQGTRALWAEPVFAGERIAWVTLAPGEPAPGYELHLAAPDGSGHRSQVVAAPPAYEYRHRSVSLAASARRVAASIHQGYYTSKKGGTFRADYSAVLSGPPDAQLEPFAVPCATDAYLHRAVAVDGDAVAYVVCGSKVVVRDYETGRDHELPPAGSVSLAGPYIATHDYRQVVVWEWRTGEARLRIEGPIEWADVQSDGTVAFVRREGTRYPVEVASPSEPAPRRLAEDSARSVQIARNRVVFGALPGVTVRTLDGTEVAASRSGRVGDFDGERLAWGLQPCALVALVTWDLQGEAPALPAAPCPMPSLRSAMLRAKIRPYPGPERVSIELDCPPEPALGCGGSIGLYSRDGRSKRGDPSRRIDLASGGYALMPGERRTVKLPYRPGRVCIARHHGRRPILILRHSGLHPSVKHHRVQVAGLDRAIAACAK